MTWLETCYICQGYKTRSKYLINTPYTSHYPEYKSGYIQQCPLKCLMVDTMFCREELKGCELGHIPVFIPTLFAVS